MTKTAIIIILTIFIIIDLVFTFALMKAASKEDDDEERYFNSKEFEKKIKALADSIEKLESKENTDDKR